MANQATGNLSDAQVRINKKYQAPEMRLKPFPLLRMFLGNQDKVITNLEDIRKREDRGFDIHLMARTRRAAGNERVYNHQGTIDDTAKITPTFSTYSDKTKISLKLMDKNVFTYEETLANKIDQMIMNLLESAEADLAAWILSQKSQYSQTLKGPMTFNQDADVVQISTAIEDKMLFFQTIKSLMRQNYHEGMYDVIADNIMAPIAEFYANQGGSNSVNTSFQFSNLRIVESNELYDGNYPKGSVIIMPMGSACSLSWIPKQNREGKGNFYSYLGGYGAIVDPFGLGLPIALHGYSDRADTSGSNGSKQDDVLELEASFDLTNVLAPLTGGVGESVAFQASLVP